MTRSSKMENHLNDDKRLKGAPRSPFGSGITFGKDARGNPEVIIPKGSPLSALDPFIKAGLVKDIYIGPTKFPRQAFAIGSEVFQAMDPADVEATFKDMSELGIAKAPYPDFDLICLCKDVFKTIEDFEPGSKPFTKEELGNSQIIIRYHEDFLIDALFDWRLPRQAGPFSLFDTESMKDIKIEEFERFKKNLIASAETYRRMLIVLLATKNVEKSVATDKLAKLGIGKNKQRHWYTTTLKIGTITETVRTPGEPTGRTLRPHLRRGHRRNQHFGPGRQFVKAVWIEPTFVNADENFVSARTNYNVSKGHE